MEVLLVPLFNFLLLPAFSSSNASTHIVCSQENEMQEQRHEVCLKCIGSGSGASSRWPASFGSNWPDSMSLEGWNIGMMEQWVQVSREKFFSVVLHTFKSIFQHSIIPCGLCADHMCEVLTVIWRENGVPN